VDNAQSGQLTEIDPATGKAGRTITDVTDPYNMYFTPDGSKAIVVAEEHRRLDFRDPKTWKVIRSLRIPWAGIDHMDFTADGRYALASTEFAGVLVKVDTETMTIAGTLDVGGLPIDVRLARDGSVFYVANQGRHGVSIVDPAAMKEVGFLPTAKGAHGMAVSRDARSLYVSNRLAGSISVIDFATRTVVATWKVGGSPDMEQVSSDGTQLWVSNRFHGTVTVVDTRTGKTLKVIRTGGSPHGLCYFPQPGRFSLGHNGVYR
jgi:YVTN family beta-propeller protein